MVAIGIVVLGIVVIVPGIIWHPMRLLCLDPTPAAEDDPIQRGHRAQQRQHVEWEPGGIPQTGRQPFVATGLQGHDGLHDLDQGLADDPRRDRRCDGDL